MGTVGVGILGTGNIGTDLLVKLGRSEVLTCAFFSGRNPDSNGIQIANKLGITTSYSSIDYLLEHPNCCDIVFDATTAKAHAYHAPILKELGKFAIDLTPAHVGDFCVPAVNLEAGLHLDNVNLVTCGGQATLPIAKAIIDAGQDVRYYELIATIASKSAGLGTRNNIDEFTQTTHDALVQMTGVKHAKAIIILNPAEPPITMRNTLYACIDNPDMNAIRHAVRQAEQRIRAYVPGFRVALGPVYESGRVTTTVEVTGSGDYLPKYAGNLDIITCAAIEIAEAYALRRQK